jgi:hypothetical protein
MVLIQVQPVNIVLKNYYYSLVYVNNVFCHISQFPGTAPPTATEIL